MRLESREKSGVMILMPLEKNIDASVAQEFKDKLQKAIFDGHVQVVLDLSQVDFVDSSGIGVMVSALKLIGDKGDLVLCEVKKQVMNVFKLTRLDRVFRITETRDEATELLKNST